MSKMLLLCSFLTVTAFAQPLGDVLQQQKSTFTQKMPKHVVDLYEQNIKDLKALGIEKKALKVGDKVPDFEVKLNGEKHPISHVLAAGTLVLKFYRGGWCGYCMTELKHYEELNTDFKSAGAQIIAISPDTEEMSKKTRSKNNLSFDLLSDSNHAIAKKFGLVYDLDSKVVQHMKENGIDLAQYQGDDKADLSMPATYVISKEGRIVFSFVDADYRKRAEPSIVLEAVKKIQKK